MRFWVSLIQTIAFLFARQDAYVPVPARLSDADPKRLLQAQ
jgi:hypothetical protein